MKPTQTTAKKVLVIVKLIVEATKIFYASAEVVTFNVNKKALLTVMSVREVVASCSIICSEQ